MKKEKIFILSTFLVFLVIGLNTKFMNVPPLGKIISPFSGFMQNSYENIPAGELDLNNLEAPVKIIFDNRAVPHVFAENENDLFFAQGYLHAKDRLWQMDFLYRAAAGRLSEVVGIKTIDKDRAIRRKGLLVSAEKSLEYISKFFPQTVKHLDAYAKGANAYINTLKQKDYPIEFKLMNYAPEEWTPLKTILIQKYMANMLSGFDTDAERTNALKFFGKQDFDLLYETDLTAKAPMIDSFSGGQQQQTGGLTPIYLKSQKGDAFHKDLYQPRPGYGSNTWAVSAQKSSTGFPMLANDPHLALTLPSIWYEIQLSSSGSNSYGVSIPGAPYIIIGFNQHIAWGITNGATDVKDWYALKFRNNNDEYYYAGKWRKTVKRIEKFTIAGFKDLTDTILETEAGPVIYDQQFNPEQNATINMAMQWEGNAASNDFNTFYLLNESKNYDDYRHALTFFKCPNLNFSFASKTDIAISHQGSVPQRRYNEGEFVIDGGLAEIREPKKIAEDYLPTEKNPSKQFIFSANQNPVGKGYPYHLYGYYGVYRNRTIETNLSAPQRISVDDMKSLQFNDYDLFAAEALPVMLKNIDRSKLSPLEKGYIDSLSNWDYKYDRNKLTPLIFQAWWGKFIESTWDEIADRTNPVLMPKDNITLKLLSNNPASKYFDVQATPETENAKDILLSALKFQANEIDKYQKQNGGLTWGTAKNTSFEHLAQLSAFSNRVNCNGSAYTVNASSADWGAGWRMIVEFGKDSPVAWGINPGGQSGNPGSAYYADGIEDWSNGKYYRLVFMKNTDESLKDTQTFILK
jgi:penicillin G amidase